MLVTPDAEPEPIDLHAVALPANGPIVPIVTNGDETIAYILNVGDETAAAAAVAPLAAGAVFTEIMFFLGRFELSVRQSLLRALAIERWSNRYRFCASCGAPLVWTTDAVAKICTNAQRVHRHFPRLDPAIIVLVTDGERALLGRSKRFPPGWFSTLAGFVEPGESVEAALRREVYEEAGIRVGAVRYFGSEPWPFPRSLMLGYFATAESSAITLRDAELEEARWFDRQELSELQARMRGARPYFDTIARRLIETWLARAEPA